MLSSQGRPLPDMQRAVMARQSTFGTSARRAWYVAYTKPRQEYVARDNLHQQTFETYLPMLKAKMRESQHPARPGEGSPGKAAFEPMFPRYLFFRPGSPGQSLAAARSTRGISSLIAFGGELATLSEETLGFIQSIESQRNAPDQSVRGTLRPGSRVRLRASPLQGMEGLVQAVSSRRVMLLMDILGREKAVAVSHDYLEPA